MSRERAIHHVAHVARAVAIILAGVTAVPVSAHRLDEYLQAARLDIAPDRVEVQLDLTPGIAIAPRIVADIDTDGNRTISPGEGEAYATRILKGLRLDLDGRLLAPALVSRAFPPAEALLQGTGVIRLTFVASLAPVGTGPHHLRYENTNRPEIGVYLANALVPQSDRVAIADQRRNVNQQELIIDYTLGPEPPWLWRVLLAAIAVAIGVTGWLWLEARHFSSRAGTPPDPPRPAA